MRTIPPHNSTYGMVWYGMVDVCEGWLAPFLEPTKEPVDLLDYITHVRTVFRSLNTFGKDGNTNATITADPFETQLTEDQKADFQIRAKGSDLL